MENFKFTPGPGMDLEKLIRPKLVHVLQETVDAVEADAVATAPYRTGALAKSSRTAVRASDLLAGVGFSDPKAVAAHENMHDHLRHGRRAKFLELALQEHADEFMQHAAAELRRFLK